MYRERAKYGRIICRCVAAALSEFAAVEPMRDPLAPDVMEDEYVVESGLSADGLRSQTAPLVRRFCRRIEKEFRGRFAACQVRVEPTRNPDEYRVVLIATLGTGLRRSRA